MNSDQQDRSGYGNRHGKRQKNPEDIKAWIMLTLIFGAIAGVLFIFSTALPDR